MALDNRSPSSALFKRAEQLRRWQESETNRVEIYDKPRKVNFSDGCIFLAACAAGDKNEVLRLLEKGADIDTANVDGLTALHAACIDDNLDMVEFLVDQGADVNRGDMEGWTPLHATASCGFNSIAQFLIDRGADLALVNNDGDLCIDIADSEEMEGLLQNEVDTRGIDCEASRNEEERRMREDAQRWLNTGYCADRPHPKTGASALHVAAAKGYHKVMNILLEAGADINAQDFDGWTPLHAAAHWGQREAVEILCENESDMEVRNYVGQSSFDVADNGLIKLLDELKRKQASRRLIINRKRKNSPNRDSRKKKEKEDQHDSDGTSSDESTSDVEKKNKVNKENVAQIIPTSTPERNNGRSPVTTPNKTTDSMDESEVQSWRRPSSLRNKTSPPDDKSRQEEVTRTLSTPARISSSREEEAIQRTSSSPEKDESRALSVSGGSCGGGGSTLTQSAAAANRERLKARSCPTLTHLDGQEQGGGTLTGGGGGGETRGQTLTQTLSQTLPSTTAPICTNICHISSGFSTPLTSLSLTQSQRLSSSAQNIPSAHSLSSTSSQTSYTPSVRSHQPTPTCMDWTLSTASQQQMLLNKLSTSQSQLQNQPICEAKSLPSSLNRSQGIISSPMQRPVSGINQNTIPNLVSVNQTPPSNYVENIISSQSQVSGDKGILGPTLATVTSTTALSDITTQSHKSGPLNSNRILTSLSPVIEQTRSDAVHNSINSSLKESNSFLPLPLSGVSSVSVTSVTYSNITTTAMPTITTITVSSPSSVLTSSASTTYTTATPGLDSFSTNTSTNIKDPRLLFRSQSLKERIYRNHVDSMTRVSIGDPTTGVLNTSISPPARSVGRSFVPPSRDEESETQRKAHAKMVRSTRRSTQGVTLEDVKSAEQLMKNKKQEQFTLESVAKSKEIENEVDSVTAPLRKKSTDVGDEEKESERTSQTREGTQAVLQRRKKPKRRSTGRVQVNMDEIDPEKRAARLAEQQQKAAAGEEASDDDEEEEDSSLSERGEGTKAASSNVNSRSTTRSTSLGPENGEPDYKKLYEEQLAENAKILDRLRITETDLQTTRETIEANNKKNNTEKREKRALERKLSEMEEELKLLEHLKQENQKLKDENGALIRVISKLSK